jgi:TatD DNase family protein
MSLAEKHARQVATLRDIGDPQERLAFVVQQGRKAPGMPESLRTEGRRVPGCQSRLWFSAEMSDGRCRFHADSDSAIVKGIAALLCGFFDGETPGDILAYTGDFLAEAGLQHHLSPNRRQGLGKLRGLIQEFARSHTDPNPGTPGASTGAAPLGRWMDAHNHLQDERFGGRQGLLVAEARRAGVCRMVVNGSCEADWPAVRTLAQQFPEVLPSFGVHPWYVREQTEQWRERLVGHLDEGPAAIGEIGLDRWIPDPDIPRQEETFLWQLQVAAERNLPASVHCLKAWGRLEELLRTHARPARGFLLHSYGGPAEMVAGFVRLGAYFSFPGYFLHERKRRQRETFRQVPMERLLVETDAPDQLLPEPLDRFHLRAPDGTTRLNHPGTLAAVYEGLAGLREVSTTTLAEQVEGNFARLFGPAAPGT